MSRLLRAAAAALLVVGLLPGGVAAASPTFETPTATATFGTGVTFTQAFESPVPLARVEVLLTFPDSLGPFVAQAAGATAAGPRELTFRWSLGDDGHLVPNTPDHAPAGGWCRRTGRRRRSAGPAVRVVYEDTRFDWRTVAGRPGPAALVRGLRRVRAARPRDRRAGGPGGRGLPRGHRDPIRSTSTSTPSRAPSTTRLAPARARTWAARPTRTSGRCSPSSARTTSTDPWVGIVIPHELTHLVFDTAVRNPYHFPPRWLNEGVAIYLSEGYTAVRSERADRGRRVRRAAHAPPGAGRPVPDDVRAVRPGLRGEHLGGRLPGPPEGHRRAGLADQQLCRRRHATTRRSLPPSGTDLAGFESAWLDDLGAAAPVQHGPQPAPAGPLPPGLGAGASPAAPGATVAPGAAPVPSPGDGPSDASPCGAGLAADHRGAGGAPRRRVDRLRSPAASRDRVPRPPAGPDGAAGVSTLSATRPVGPDLAGHALRGPAGPRLPHRGPGAAARRHASATRPRNALRSWRPSSPCRRSRTPSSSRSSTCARRITDRGGGDGRQHPAGARSQRRPARGPSGRRHRRPRGAGHRPPARGLAGAGPAGGLGGGLPGQRPRPAERRRGALAGGRGGDLRQRRADRARPRRSSTSAARCWSTRRTCPRRTRSPRSGRRTCTTTLAASAGFVDLVRMRVDRFGIRISFAQPATVTVPAYAGSVTLRYARPPAPSPTPEP